MWLFTRHGFFSAVCEREGNGSYIQPVDPDRIMVRARVKSHLEALKTRFPELLGGSDIQSNTGTDYAYRIFVAKPAWSQVVAGLADELDYDNFKSEVAKYQGRGVRDYEHALHGVWEVMHKLQRQ